MYVYKIIFLILLVCTSCNSKDVDPRFYSETSKRWMAAREVSWASEHYRQNMAILTPKGTWQAILRVNFLDQNLNEVSDCVFYRVPSENEEGKLKVVANPEIKSCQGLLAEEGYVEFEDIINFGYEYNDSLKSKENLILKIDTHDFKYDFLNLKKKIKKHELLNSSASQTKIKGAVISSEINYKKEEVILKEGTICFDVQNDCKVIKKDECHLCEKGYYQTVSSACPRLFRKVCGKDRCGTKNNPACLRGYMASGLDPKAYCIQGSPVGICQKGLRVVCINNTLFCE